MSLCNSKKVTVITECPILNVDDLALWTQNWMDTQECSLVSALIELQHHGYINLEEEE